MKKILILILLLAGGFFISKLTGLGTQEGAEKSARKSRWSNAKVGDSDHSTRKNTDQANSLQKSSQDQGHTQAKATPKQNNKKTEANSSANPFFKKEEDLKDLTWEQARAFAFREINFKPQNEEEASLLEMNRMMAATFMVPNSHLKLIEYYQSKGLKPDVSRDSNPYTGTMTTIRTDKSLPGTRYNHSQVFDSENNVNFMQHTSIEYRPGPQAFERTIEMVEELYGVKEGQMRADGHFVKYNLGQNQILWIQKLKKEDLNKNPFNAHEDSDVGTIMMAIEQEIHHDDDGNDHDHSSP